MKKKIIFSLLVIIAIIIAINILLKKESQELITVTIPESFYKLCNQELDQEEIQSYIDKGMQAEKKGNDLVITFTKSQREQLIEQNKMLINKSVEMLKSENDAYYIIPDEDYKEVNIYIDEKANALNQSMAILGITSEYAFTYMLLNETSDWNVHLKIYNCHTKKLVAEARLPEEGLEYGAEEWEESYNE